MTYWQAWMACGLLMALPAAAEADIFRWDNGQLIPGTEGFTPGPGVDLSSPMGQWSSPQRNLRFADFSGGLDLTEASFWRSWLDNSDWYPPSAKRVKFAPATTAPAKLALVSVDAPKRASVRSCPLKSPLVRSLPINPMPRKFFSW
jgi:hypothetical protein